MQFEHREIDGIQILKVAEKRIDLSNHLDLKREITRLARKDGRYLVLDLELVQLLDSSALGIVILCSRGACGDCTPVLCNVHRKILSIFRVARLEPLLLLAEDVEAALDLVREQMEQGREQTDGCVASSSNASDPDGAAPDTENPVSTPSD
jgi:anti-anti-sigma factor